MWVGCRARMVVKTTNNVTHSDVLYFSEDETHRNSLGKAVASKVLFGIYVLPFSATTNNFHTRATTIYDM